MATKNNKAAASSDLLEYKVLTVTEIDRLVYRRLAKQGAAKPSSKDANSYVITDKEKAQSTNILPQILNPLGVEGWRLVAVNKMECFIFAKGPNAVPLEYKVMTPPQLDHLGLTHLEKKGHLELTGFEGDAPTVELTSPEEAKIQVILPSILQEIASEGWELAAVSGPQLYFFTRALS